ncbi:MAG TPA: glycoside hydrolase [Chthonomonadales bacterium]|nr:glycoside hydrolase [Chthonomonadales bacterium]
MLPLLLLTAAACLPAPPAAVRWDFSGGTEGWSAGHQCRLRAEAGSLVVEALGADPFFHGPSIRVQGPAEVRMRARFRSAGQGRLYWTTLLPSLSSTAWSEDAALYYDLRHDGVWREITLPIDAEGVITQIRLDPGKAAGIAEYDWIEVRPVSDEVPRADAGATAGLPAALEAQDGPLHVRFETRSRRFTVRDRRTGRRWTSAPDPGVGLLDGEALSKRGMRLRLLDRSSGLRFTGTVTVDGAAGSVRFAVKASASAHLTRLAWPPRLQEELAAGALVFTNRSSGQLIDQRDDYPQSSFFCYGNLGLDMPWFGVIDRKRGDGMMLLIETPVDALVELRVDARGRRWPRVVWVGAKERFAYTRIVTARFAPRGGYVALARMYREHARRSGLLVTLAAKARQRPRVAWLKGAPILWGISFGEGRPESAARFGREAKAAGIRRAVVHANHKLPEEDIRLLTSLGFLSGEYDNYDDIREGPVGLTTDNVERVALRGRDGQPAKGWLALDGTQFYRRASSMALETARAFVPGILKEHPFTCRLVDVSTTIDLMEDWTPERGYDRRGDMRHRLALLRYLASLGLVVGGEHGKAWNVPVLDYAEGRLSGSFWWEMPAGHLQVPKSREDLKPNFLRYGMDPSRRIPLWELVFHDCVVGTWYWGDASGYYTEVAPELNDRQDLFTMLHGGVPLMWLNHLSYGWNRNRARLLQSYRATCLFHEAVAFEDMVSHEFLTSDRAVQRTRFANGGVCTVNFGDTPRAVRDGARQVMLAPRGYLARAPGVEQWRILRAGRTVTWLSAPRYYSATTTAREKVGPFEVEGTVTAFQAGPRRWHVLLESAAPCRIDLKRLVGRAPSSTPRVLALNDDGTPRGPAEGAAASGSTVTLPGGAGLRLFALDW